MRYEIQGRLKCKQSGQTVVEVLLAAAVVSVALTALVSVVTTALAHNRNSQVRVIATRQAQEGIELIRVARDASITWDSFINDQLEPFDSGSSDIAYICMGANLPLFDLPTDNSDDVEATTAGGNCASKEYELGNTFYRRKATVDFSNPGVAEILVRVAWDVGTREDFVELQGVLNEKF